MKNAYYENLLERVRTNNRVNRLIYLAIGSFIAGLIYNAFVEPNNLVYGGMTGLAIVAQKIFAIKATTFITFSTLLLIVISYFLIGAKKTSYAVIGYGFYALMITLTEPIAKYFSFTGDSYLLSVIIYGAIQGIGFGLVYRTGFNTGGSDSIVSIAQEYFPFPTAYISNIVNTIIILLGAAIFGVENTLYAIVYLKVQNFMTDRTILGMSDSKICFIKTNHINLIEEYLTNDLEVGYTLIESTNGIGIFKRKVIMCVVPSDRFYDLKHELITIDKKGELISNDCYTVVGGNTNSLISI